jgi:predicted small secreted protein
VIATGTAGRNRLHQVKAFKGAIMKSFIAWVGLLLLSVVLTACNTMRGFGQDVQRGGEKVEGAASDSQKKK